MHHHDAWIDRNGHSSCLYCTCCCIDLLLVPADLGLEASKRVRSFQAFWSVKVHQVQQERCVLLCVLDGWPLSTKRPGIEQMDGWSSSCWVFAGLKKSLEAKASVLPFIGDSVRLFKDGPRLAQERSEKLGPIWGSWLFGERMFFVAKADMLKWCLNKEYDAVECAPYHSQY